ncbi:DUF4190 domain-containing protein [Agromyces atrinae]|uniref:DUF4190 domain-containing protein n=1 Tax=Agromyces atrinae TaxID=592376 RepID=UPI001F57F7BB|nr:DUF4190 domain-containing protein [Agromyces atrinae]MCI2957857.1 DUF4190 domain-containing protein [Agromyces atrinae]
MTDSNLPQGDQPAASAQPAAPAYGSGYPGAAYGAGLPGADYRNAPGKTNTLAIVSIVASLVGLFTGIGFLVGLITGHISLSQIKKTGELGRGMALAGTIIGWIGVALSILAVILFVVLFGFLAANGAVTSTY